MTDRGSTLFQLGLLMFFFLSQAHSRALTKSIHIPAVIHNDYPNICSRTSLEPAIKCACFAYNSIYSSDPRWSSARDFCLAELEENIQSGESYCQSSTYGEGLGSSVPERFRYQLKIRAAQFFRDARRQCVASETGTAGLAEKRLEDFYLTYLKLRRSPLASLRLLVSSNDGLSGFKDNERTGGAYAHASQASMEFKPLSRGKNLEASARKKMENFILVCTYYVGK